MAQGKTLGRLLLGLAAGWLCLTSPAVSGIILDDFNRSDSTNMGLNWTEQTGDFSISSNRATGTDYSLMTFIGATSNSVTVDAFPTGTLSYVAIVLGYASLNYNLFLKVQNQGGGTEFNTAAFYLGNNGSDNGAWSQAGFFSLSSPFASARMTATLSGTTVTLDFDTNFDGVAEQSYSRGSVPLGLGSGIGLGAYGYATMDNFSIPGQAIPEPGTAALLGSALVALAAALRRRLRSN
jgi:hypothetical protein